MPFTEQEAWAEAVEIGSIGKPVIGVGTAANQNGPIDELTGLYREWWIMVELNNGVPKVDEDGNAVSATEGFKLYYPSDRDKLNTRISELRELLKQHIAEQLKMMMEAAALRDTERRAILSQVVEINHEPLIWSPEAPWPCAADGMPIPSGGTYYHVDTDDRLLNVCPGCYQLAVDLMAAKLLEGEATDATQD